jgi:hypothetical protein
MNDFEIERNELIRFLNKTWDKLRDNEQKIMKRIVLYCPTSTHNSTTFYSHIHTYIHLVNPLAATPYNP